MSKPKRERSLADNEAKAVARMLRVSPQKLNLVAQMIRGRKASAALADLQFSRKRIAVDVKKCLESAIANAENNHDLDVDELVVSEAHVGNPLAQLVDVGALLADHDAGTRRMDRHPALLVRALDHDPGDCRLFQLLVQHLANLDVLVQQLAVLVLTGEPTGIPGTVDTEAEPNWIDLLTHRILPRLKRSPRPDEPRSSVARTV